jgi:hypothetical protein
MNANTAGSSFIDANQDGVCDNYGTRQGSGRGIRNRK